MENKQDKSQEEMVKEAVEEAKKNAQEAEETEVGTEAVSYTHIDVYKRQTYDFESEEDGAVTIRDRDTMEQERVKIDELDAYFAKKFEW